MKISLILSFHFYRSFCILIFNDTSVVIIDEIMCLKTLGASLIISISKFNYQDLYSFSTSIVNDYIDIILNSKNYHDNNSNAFTTPPPPTTTTSRHTRKNTATTTYASNCDDVNHNHYQLLCIPFNSTAAIITIQKSHHLMLIKTKL